MAHARKALRAAVAARLTNATSMGARVYSNRQHPVVDLELPCVVIETSDDFVNQATVFAPQLYMRQLTVDIVVKAKVVANVDDVLDDLCAEIEPLMVDIPGVDETPEFVETRLGFSGTLEKPAGEARMTYRIPYQTAAADPGTQL